MHNVLIELLNAPFLGLSINAANELLLKASFKM